MAEKGTESAAEQVILDKIAEGLPKEEKANAYMTLALKYLEGAEFVKAYNAGIEVLVNSKNIEQRLAAVHVIMLAKTMDKGAVMSDLSFVYDF